MKDYIKREIVETAKMTSKERVNIALGGFKFFRVQF